MPNGRPYDNPVTDTVVHRLHPFPAVLERLVLELYTRNPRVFDELGNAPFDWEKGKHLSEAKKLLQGLLDAHGDPNAYRKLITLYVDATGGSGPDA